METTTHSPLSKIASPVSGKLAKVRESLALSDEPSSRRKQIALRFFAVTAVLGALYFLDRKRRGSSEKSEKFGVSIGPDSKEIDLSKKFDNGKKDVVDQASWESFPASDPPAY